MLKRILPFLLIMSAAAWAQSPNSRRYTLDIELPAGSSAVDQWVKARAESLWKQGQTRDALALLSNGTRADMAFSLIADSVKAPYGLISPRDSIHSVDLYANSDGTALFSLIRFFDATFGKGWGLYHSTDQGETWDESFLWFNSRPVQDVKGVMSPSFFYVTYTRDFADSNAVNVRRFRLSDAVNVRFGDEDNSIFLTVLSAPPEKRVRELAPVVVNEQSPSLYTFALGADDSLRGWVEDENEFLWNRLPSGVGQVAGGLAARSNHQGSVLDVALSFLSLSGEVKVMGKARGDTTSATVDLWSSWASVAASGADTATALWAFGDSLVLAYSRNGTGTISRYAGDQEVETVNLPAAASIDGFDLAGADAWRAALVYRHAAAPHAVWGAAQAMNSPWSPEVEATDTLAAEGDPALVWLGGSDFGVAYIARDSLNMSRAFFKRVILDLPSHVNRPVAALQGFQLHANAPNPFNPVTRIDYDIPAFGRVVLEIYDVRGRRVARLVNQGQSAGHYSISWHPKSAAGGVYFSRLSWQGRCQVSKMVYIK